MRVSPPKPQQHNGPFQEGKHIRIIRCSDSQVLQITGWAKEITPEAAAGRDAPAGVDLAADSPASTWFGPSTYYDSADKHMLTVCVIEENRAPERVDAIAATPGVDVLFIGTSDLSLSLGLRERPK
jgi:2-keto-3-deoxy-L-rhamnonate aldolase RhmA